MRILHTGNPVSGYIMTRELRKRGIEADLLIEKFQIEGSFLSINNSLDHDKSLKELLCTLGAEYSINSFPYVDVGKSTLTTNIIVEK